MTSIEQTFQMAVQCHQAGNLPQADQYYRQVLQMDPQHLNALHLFGVLACQAGRSDIGITYIQEALRLKPDFAEAYGNLGNAYRDQGRLDDAIASYRQAIRLQPHFAGTYANMGNALKEQGKLEDAVTSYRQALRLKPDFAQAHHDLGTALVELRKPEEAVASFRQAVQFRPDHAEAYVSLGVALLDLRKLDEATASLQQALKLRPDYPEALNGLASTLIEQGKLDEALTALHHALRLKPDLAEVHTTLGNALMEQGKLNEALSSFRQALLLRPDYGPAHSSMGMTWLLMGDYEQGWPAYEWRWKCKEFILPAYRQPFWDGSPLNGRTILLHAEQGMGDTLQFVRYAPLVQARGGRVLLACHPALVLLLAECAGIDRLIAHGTSVAPSEFDLHAPLMSLPTIFRTTLATLPAKVPYLFADAALTERWKEQLKQYPGFKIGIAWQGDPKYRRDAQRSIPLKHFAPLAALEGVQLISLQKGPGIEQLSELDGRFSVIDLGSKLDEAAGAFMDTAAVMKNLDLVITSDTAIAHLAGGLGVAVWVALPRMAEWRWLLDRADSPWYPTMRLFRQSEAGNWPQVFEQITAEVKELLTSDAISLRAYEKPDPRPIRVEIAPGELIDKITILEIKNERITDAAKRANVQRELKALQAVRDRTLPPSDKLKELSTALRAVNEALWQVEDDIRMCERNGDFGPRFIELARSVYQQNDQRAAIKREISQMLGSRFVEEKEFTVSRQSTPKTK